MSIEHVDITITSHCSYRKPKEDLTLTRLSKVPQVKLWSQISSCRTILCRDYMLEIVPDLTILVLGNHLKKLTSSSYKRQ